MRIRRYMFVGREYQLNHRVGGMIAVDRGLHRIIWAEVHMMLLLTACLQTHRPIPASFSGQSQPLAFTVTVDQSNGLPLASRRCIGSTVHNNYLPKLLRRSKPGDLYEERRTPDSLYQRAHVGRVLASRRANAQSATAAQSTLDVNHQTKYPSRGSAAGVHAAGPAICAATVRPAAKTNHRAETHWSHAAAHVSSSFGAVFLEAAWKPY